MSFKTNSYFDVYIAYLASVCYFRNISYNIRKKNLSLCHKLSTTPSKNITFQKIVLLSNNQMMYLLHITTWCFLLYYFCKKYSFFMYLLK